MRIQSTQQETVETFETRWKSNDTTCTKIESVIGDIHQRHRQEWDDADLLTNLLTTKANITPTKKRRTILRSVDYQSEVIVQQQLHHAHVTAAASETDNAMGSLSERVNRVLPGDGQRRPSKGESNVATVFMFWSTQLNIW